MTYLMTYCLTYPMTFFLANLLEFVYHHSDILSDIALGILSEISFCFLSDILHGLSGGSSTYPDILTYAAGSSVTDFVFKKSLIQSPKSAAAG